MRRRVWRIYTQSLALKDLSLVGLIWQPKGRGGCEVGIKTKAELEAGKKVGNLVVVGDTGKRSKNRSVVVLVKDDLGNYKEVLSSNLFSKPHAYTGWTPERYEIARKNGEGNVDKMHNKVIFDGKNLSALSKETPQTNSETGYRGIFWNKTDRRWKAVVQVGKNCALNKSFKQFEEAVLARNDFMQNEINPLLEKNGFSKIAPIQKVEINNYVHSKTKELKEYDEFLEKKRLLFGLKKIQDSKGVSFRKNINKWRAYARENGKQKNLGVYETEQEAINAKQNYVQTVIEPQIKKLQEEINHV